MNFDNGITELQKLPNERSAFYITSTDRKYVALRVVTIDEGASYPEKLVIINAQGERVYTTAWRDHWSSLLFFPDIEHLILSLDEINGHEIVSFFSPVPYTIFNIPTGKEQIYSYSFSGFVTNVYPVLPRWNTLHGLSYDPTLTRAIYPRDVDKNPDIFTYAIWDLENDSLMTTLDDVVYTYKPYIPRAPGPHWYADGSHFLVVGHVFSDELEDLSTTEVFRVSRDGVPEEITQLGRKFLVESHNISLSPDGRKVTLFLKANPSPKKAQLAILDLETLEIVDTCIRISTDDMINPPSPIWFPDGKQFLVFDKQNEEDSRVILVDIDQQRAAVIADDVEPVAWMLDK
jgi:hypothetical protein